MKAPELLADLRRHGLNLAHDPNGVRVGPSRLLTEEAKRAIVGRRSELLGLLNPDPFAYALRAEAAEVERRDFPGGFPPVLARCVGHYLAGPTAPPVEGLAAWWAGARRQILWMIETVKRDPARYSAWRPPE
jgi:hypothetical protein